MSNGGVFNQDPIQDLIDVCRIESISTKIQPTMASLYRGFCREYSKVFHTPLHLVFNLDPELVLTNLFEDKIADSPLDKNVDMWLKTIKLVEDPNYEEVMEKDLDNFVERALEEEKERLKSGTSVVAAHAKKTLLKKVKEEVVEKGPQGGSVDFSGMGDEEG